jgi:hypothetical protein
MGRHSREHISRDRSAKIPRRIFCALHAYIPGRTKAECNLSLPRGGYALGTASDDSRHEPGADAQLSRRMLRGHRGPSRESAGLTGRNRHPPQQLDPAYARTALQSPPESGFFDAGMLHPIPLPRPVASICSDRPRFNTPWQQDTSIHSACFSPARALTRTLIPFGRIFLREEGDHCQPRDTQCRVSAPCGPDPFSMPLFRSHANQEAIPGRARSPMR